MPETVQTREGQWVNVHGADAPRGMVGSPIDGVAYPSQEAAIAAMQQAPPAAAPAPQAPAAAGAPSKTEQLVMNFLKGVQSLPPEEQAQYKRAFFTKIIAPSDEWQAFGQPTRRGLVDAFGMPPETAVGAIGGQLGREGEIKGPQSFMERVLGRAGGITPASSPEGQAAPWRRAAGNVMTIGQLPFAAAGEAVDTAVDPYRRGGRPMGNQGLSVGQQAEYATYIPQVMRALLRTPGALNRFLDVLNTRMGTPDPARALTFRGPVQRMLPPAGGGTQIPFPMPPSSLPPQMPTPFRPMIGPQPAQGPFPLHMPNRPNWSQPTPASGVPPLKIRMTPEGPVVD